MAPAVIGRDAELVALEAFLDDVASGPKALVLRGEAGIGKTAIWEAGIEAAWQRGHRVLLARPTLAEGQMSYAVVADLVATVEDDFLEAVPAPQRDALNVALLRSEPVGRPPEPRAIAAGLLAVLRELANAAPVVVAIDDVQWLDAPSADALTFAARRLQGDAVGFLLTTRPEGPSGFWRAINSYGPGILDVRTLSYGAARRLLEDRLGLGLPRRVMRKVFDTTRGNPLFALEVGRILVERGRLEIDEEVPLPSDVEDLLGIRVAGLPEPVRRVLLAVALSADLRVAQAASIVDAASLDEATDAGLLILDGDRLRVSHPLVSAAARSQAHARERSAAHLDLARVATDDELKARHLAMAATRPDEELALTVSAAAAAASARGARHDAVALARHALRLTPADSTLRADRLLAVGESLDRAGDLSRLKSLLGPEVELLPPGSLRARGHLLLLEAAATSDEFDGHLESALAQSALDPILRGRALAEKALTTALSYVERLPQSEAWASESVSLGGPTSESMSALGWVRILRGRSIDELVDLRRAPEVTTSEIFYSLDRVAAISLAFRGHVGLARAALSRLLALADERGEAWSCTVLLVHLCELELRAGEMAAAEARIVELDSSLEDVGIGELAHGPRCRALLAAEKGDRLESDAWTDRAMTSATVAAQRGDLFGWDRLEVLRARGIAALFAGDPELAAEKLRTVWRHTQREGIDDPGAFPAAPDLVEALVALGELGEATLVIERLSELAHDQNHPWGLASTLRCRAIAKLASDPADVEAFAALSEAASSYGELGLRFDHARSLLILGRAQRRARRWGDARESLEQALASFDGVGSTGWADQARSELGRVGARRPAAAGTLTPAEAKVVELAAEGRSNKEIAQALASSVHTVEVQLSRAYAKLGVQSRAQLARRLATGPTQ